MASSLFDKITSSVDALMDLNTLSAIEHYPVGASAHQPSLHRGPGLRASKGALYSKRVTRFTVEKMRNIINTGTPFLTSTGVNGPFTAT